MRCAWAIPLFSLAAGSLEQFAQPDAASLLQHASFFKEDCLSGKCEPKPRRKPKGVKKPNVDVFPIDQVESVLPRAPDWYPDNLKGVIWMDQVGFYGRSDISDGAPDGTLSFGDPANLLDPESREIPVSITGPGWQWFNNAAGYAKFKEAEGADFIYNFEWNKEYTFARIVPTIKKFIKVPGSKVNYTMELQPMHQDASICPPRSDASREDITRCAKWKRVSTFNSSPNAAVYFAYEIVDKDGNRVQPYYNKYLEWVGQNSKPDQEAANATGLVFKSDLKFKILNMKGPTAFHGLKGVKKPRKLKGVADCPAGTEATQACHLIPMLRSLAKKVGCPRISKKFCGEMRKTRAVFAGKKRPFLADQKYLVDMAKLGSGYSSAFYGASDKCCGSGDKSCCDHARANFPGPEAVSVLNNAQIAAKMQKVPARQASGAITRRNMLGFILLNDIFWHDLPEGQQGLGLGGQSLAIHSLVRPILDGIFGHDAKWDAPTIQKSAADFMSNRSKMNFQNDPKLWTTQVLHQIVFGVDLSEKDAQDFVDFQGKVVAMTALPQFLVDAARSANLEDKLHQALGIPDVLAKKDEYLQRWLPVVQERYCQHCNDTEATIVNSNVLDALIFAGGLSVPGVIAPGISILYAGDVSPSPGFQLTRANALLFAWETARYFPPVLGFGYVDETEDRPLQIMALGAGQRAADAWGKDAETPSFRLRDYETYQKFWVGHADHAEDKEGTGTRRCPGKTLSMKMIEAWYKAWDQAAWAPAENTTFNYTDKVLFVNDFTLLRTSESARADDLT